MSSYHLPIILGQDQDERIVMIHMIDDEEENYEENRVVITTPGNAATPLFRISDQTRYIGITGDLVDIDFYRGDNLLVAKVGERQLEPRHSGSFWVYRVNRGVFDDVVTFSTNLDDSNGQTREFKGSLHIVRPRVTDIVMRINADLGSDATQINYFIQQQGNGIQSVDLVQKMVDEYASDRDYSSLTLPANGDPLFMQQERKNDHFYKTGNITFQKGGNINAGILDSDAFINYLNVSAAGKNEPSNKGKDARTWNKEIPFNKKLINIKMLYSHYTMPQVTAPVAGVTFTDGARTGRVSNQNDLIKVLHAIYKQLIHISASIEADGCHLFSILLLVPNIYVQQNIDSLLYELNKMNQNDLGFKYDFRIISESDSAFVGIKELRQQGLNSTILSVLLQDVTNPRQKDTFLIIDAGKGTTDYSIIKYDTDFDNNPNNNMVSIKRGGIVGAGGAIDYVFARIFARQIYNHFTSRSGILTNVTMEHFTDRFMTMIEKLNARDQDRIMLFVEFLKKHYREKQNCVAMYNCFMGANAQKIINALLQDGFTDDIYAQIDKNESAWEGISKWVWDGISYVPLTALDIQEVEWVCDAIASTIIDDMIFTNPKDRLNKQIDYVIFNGRSFLFKPLKDAFIRRIERHRGVWAENVGWLRARPIMSRMWTEDDYNLKIAELGGFDMKAVSVRFDNHNLGVNCNSDLCCMDRVQMEDDEIFDQSNFWNGFVALNNAGAEVRHFYIGYNNYSFAPYLNQNQNNVAVMGPTRTTLVLMTLFPVRYERVTFDADGIPPYAAAPNGDAGVASVDDIDLNAQDSNNVNSVPASNPINGGGQYDNNGLS